MKKISLFCISSMLVGLQSCNSDVKNNEQRVAVKDTAKITVPLDRDDIQFAIQAENSALAEVELGKLAEKKGLDKRVKNSGAMAIKDHAKAGAKLEQIAKNKKILLPFAIDSAEQRIIENLGKNTGAAFDKAYLNEMTREHEANIKLFQVASKQLMDADLRAYAAKNLLVFKRHLDDINVIRGSVK
jgi:putative membrane protein